MWGVPVDDNVFSTISSEQWLWYFYNYMFDEQKEFESKRDFIEYHASFVAPQAVKQIKDSRDNMVGISDDNFIDNIEGIFGRKVNLPNKESQK